ncbi:MAG: cytochrome-c peroxidase [Azovibrio sp.]
MNIHNQSRTVIAGSQGRWLQRLTTGLAFRVSIALVASIGINLQAGAVVQESKTQVCRSESGKWDMTCLRQLYLQPQASWPQPWIEGNGHWEEMAPVPEVAEASKEDPLAQLGQRLFFDPMLSASGTIACASCHVPTHGFSDPNRVSQGHLGKTGNRNSPALVGVGAVGFLFWDGRSPSLEQQALDPIANPVEMALNPEEVPAKLRLRESYRISFMAAFGDMDISLERIQSALATFQRGLQPVRTAFDRFLEKDADALSDEAVLGLHLFRTQAQCMTCHHGPLLSDQEFHNLGLTYYGRSKFEDWGRYGVTGKNEDMGKFRTPTLRNISMTGPWMHNGLFPSLKGIVNMYNAGMFHPKPANAKQAADPRFPQTSTLVKPLKLDETEKKALEAFLRSL